MRESSSSLTEYEWRRLIATCCLSAAVFVAAVLLTRLPGASVRLSAWWTLATAILVGGLGALAIAALTLGSTRRLRPSTQSTLAVTVNGLTLLSTLATTVHSGPGQLALACLLSLSVAGACHYWSVVSGGERQAFKNTEMPTADEGATVSLPTAIGKAHDESDSHPQTLPDHVDQTLSRYTMDGRDHLEACLRVRFEAGQQTAIVHLPIQPAMQFDPEVECEPVGDSDVRINVDPAQPYGVRLVCRRPGGSTQACEAIIAVLISAERVARAAA
jgi:hypothetical protein